MKTIVSFLALSAFAGVLAAGNGEQTGGAFKATLSGWKQVPVVVTPATGQAVVTVDESTKKLKVVLEYTGLTGVPSLAQLHLAQAGAEGAAVVPICGAAPLPMCPDKEGKVEAEISEEQIQAAVEQGVEAGDLASLLQALQNGAVYVNVQTGKFPEGELRGQFGRGFKGGLGSGADSEAGEEDTETGDEDSGDTAAPGQGNGKEKDKEDKGNGKGKGRG